MKRLILLLSLVLLSSCTDITKQMETVQKKYPKSVVQPATSMLARDGYAIMMEDTINKQIYVVSFYPFSETKIQAMRNIK